MVTIIYFSGFRDSGARKHIGKSLDSLQKTMKNDIQPLCWDFLWGIYLADLCGSLCAMLMISAFPWLPTKISQFLCGEGTRTGIPALVVHCHGLGSCSRWKRAWICYLPKQGRDTDPLNRTDWVLQDVVSVTWLGRGSRTLGVEWCGQSLVSWWGASRSIAGARALTVDCVLHSLAERAGIVCPGLHSSRVLTM